MAANQRRAIQMLTEEEERGLARRWRDANDGRALARLIEAHMGLVGRIAKEYHSVGLPYEDLLQEGNLGLTIAVRRFDPERGPRLATYAAYWIRASVLNLILRAHGPVRIGTTRAQRRIFFGLARARRQVEQEGGMPAGLDQVAEALQVDPSEIEAMAPRLAGVDVSLDAPRGGGDARPWLSTLQDDGPSPEEQVMRTEERKRLRERLTEGMATLDPRERAIIRARHLRGRPATLAELGEKFGISRERIRQLEIRAKDKLGRVLNSTERAAG
jgi:RNA polymerase sigma-32 factor